MKRLPIKSPHFLYLEKAFAEWLDILGYSEGTVYYLPICVREFFHYMEQKGRTQIQQIDTPLITSYYAQLSQRKNLRRGGGLTRPGLTRPGLTRPGLSNNYLNTHLLALEKLFEYLRKNAKLILPVIPIAKEAPDTQPITPLTMDQIKRLYEATQTYQVTKPAYALRDRAILALLYDCGLRRNEAVTVLVPDVDLINRILTVRKGKGGKQRRVPFSKSTAIHFNDYLYTARPRFARWKVNGSDPSFILTKSERKKRGDICYERLKYIKQHAPELKGIRLHPHLLRHSIATHLLYQGMSLEKVAQFLGHSSLESTQIYTHLISEVEIIEQNPSY